MNLEILSNVFPPGHPAVQWIQQNNIPLIAPELIISVVLLFTLVQALGHKPKDREETWVFAMMGVAFALVSLSLQLTMVYTPFLISGALQALQFSVLQGAFQADLFSVVIRWMLVLGTAVVILFSRQYLRRHTVLQGEFYVALLAALLGGMVLSGAQNLVVMFVGLETLGISSFILSGFLRGNRLSGEASLKYLIYGGAATAVLLYGLSFLYGMTGGLTNFVDIGAVLTSVPSGEILLPIAFVLILSALAFKISAAPFHLWTPDVYEGAPTPVTAFLSVVSKTAGFAVLVRLIHTVFSGYAGGMPLLMAMAVLSMTIGNVAALAQKNVKRLLAYSTIAHAGYMLLALLVVNAQASASLVYYLMAYLAMNLGAFAVVLAIGEQLGTQQMSAYAGLIQKRPWYTVALCLFLLSLAGMPVTAGFFAKFFLFQTLVQAGTPAMIGLVVFALIASTVSLFYYVNLIRLMVVAPPSEEVAALPVNAWQFRRDNGTLNWAVVLCVLLTLGLGFYAEPTMTLLSEAVAPLSRQVTVSQLPFQK